MVRGVEVGFSRQGGFLARTLSLASAPANTRTIVQAERTAVRMDVADFRAALRELSRIFAKRRYHG